MSEMNHDKTISSLEPSPALLPPHGMEPPVLTDDLLRLCCELSSASYDMNIDPWMAAGWQDVTLEYEGRLTGVVDAAEQEAGGMSENIDHMSAALKLRAVQTMLSHRTPNQLMGTLRELKQSGTGTAIIMAHPMEEGKTLVVIAFTGTGRQIYDWVSNMRMRVEEGAHLGFLELARQFEGNLSHIMFPQTASAMGEEQLSLQQVIEACREEDSPYRILCTGHSQGGAVMQLFLLHLLRDMGVRPEHVTGVGFASPCAVVPGTVAEPAIWPMVHVVNSQDAVPRVGALLHLGRVLVYRTDDALRRACYRPVPEGEERADEAAQRMLLCMSSTPDSLLTGIAMCRHLLTMPEEKLPDSLLRLAEHSPALHRVLQSAGSGLARVLRFGVKRIRLAYESVMGRLPEFAEEEAALERVTEAAADVGLLALVSAMGRLGVDAHSIFSIAPGLQSTYQYIADRGVQALHDPEELS